MDIAAGAGSGQDRSPVARQPRERFAVVPVLLIAGAVVLGLLLLSPFYGFHRDELYFIIAGQHPAFGYPDQPPFTPLLSAAAAGLLGATPTAVRIAPAFSIGLVIVIAAAAARDLGGTRRAQVVAAIALAVSGLLAAGHFDVTATYDLLAWAIVLWLVIRLLDGGDRRWWLAVGLVAGIALENKHLPLFLGVGLAVGLLVARRWDVIRSPWAWSAVGLAALLWLPNVAWQVANGLPQLEMAGSIASRSDRADLVPELILFAGIFLFPVAIAGWWWMLRSPEARPWRAIPIAAATVLLLMVAVAGKSYYVVGFLIPLYAAGGIVVDRWIDRGRAAIRGGIVAVAAIGTLVVSALLVLPVVPLASLGSTPIPDISQITADSVGWPELVDTVSAVVDELPAEQRAKAVIFTSNYGEAGALEVLGPQRSTTPLPPVYSGHNGLWDWGPPPDELTTAIVVSAWDPLRWAPWLSACQRAATIDNGFGVDNEEQGAGVWVCPSISRPWSAVWAELRHLD